MKKKGKGSWMITHIVFTYLFVFLQLYDEFCPLLLNQFKSRDYNKFETFDAALDEFYSKIESQRSEQQQKSKENSTTQKLNKIRQDQVGAQTTALTNVIMT